MRICLFTPFALSRMIDLVKFLVTSMEVIKEIQIMPMLISFSVTADGH